MTSEAAKEGLEGIAVVKVGPKPTEYVLYKSLLEQESEYFRTALNKERNEGDEKGKRLLGHQLGMPFPPRFLSMSTITLTLSQIETLAAHLHHQIGLVNQKSHCSLRA